MDKLLNMASKRSVPIVILLTLILIAIVFIAGHFYLKVRKLETTIYNNQNTSSSLLDQVSKLIILPQDEQPTIATVTSLDQLKNQPFFANAQIGDKVIIYTNAKKAILFRPSEGKIVEVAPLNLE